MEKVPLAVRNFGWARPRGWVGPRPYSVENLCLLTEVLVKLLHHWCCISTRSHCHHGRCIRKNVCLHLEPSSGNSLVWSCQGKDFMLGLCISLGVTGVPTAHSLLLKLWDERFSKKREWTDADNLTGYIFSLVTDFTGVRLLWLNKGNRNDSYIVRRVPYLRKHYNAKYVTAWDLLL